MVRANTTEPVINNGDFSKNWENNVLTSGSVLHYHSISFSLEMQCIGRNKNLPMVYEHFFLTRPIYLESFCISFITISHPFILPTNVRQCIPIFSSFRIMEITVTGRPWYCYPRLRNFTFEIRTSYGTICGGTTMISAHNGCDHG